MKTILIADDEEHILTALAIRLQASGYRVLTAANGFEAFELALAEMPDLMVLDVWMPIAVGMQVALRMQELGLSIPIVYLTASKLPELRDAAEQAGCAAFIEKPYEPEMLLRTIEETLAFKTSAPINA